MTEGRDPDTAEAPPAARETRGTFVFRVGASRYALDLAVVRHVAEVGRVVPVPTAPAHYAGVVHDRGRVLAVVDLVKLAGLADGVPTAYARRIALEIDGRPFAVLADETLGVREVADLRAPGRADDLVLAEFDDGDAVVSLLSSEALLGRLRGTA